MTGTKPLAGKVVGSGVLAEASRRLTNVVRSDEVRRAVGEIVPPARRLGAAVRQAWKR